MCIYSAHSFYNLIRGGFIRSYIIPNDRQNYDKTLLPALQNISRARLDDDKVYHRYDIIAIRSPKEGLFTSRWYLDEIYKLEPYGVDCGIDAAAFRYTKGILHSVQHAVGLEIDSSEVVNEALRTVRKFGTIYLVADYAALTNQFLIGALIVQ